LQITNFSGNLLNTTTPREFSFDFGYSRLLTPALSIGLTFRYINSHLASGDVGTGDIYKAGTAVAADISLFNSRSNDDSQNGFAWGVVLSNLGSKIGYTNNSSQKDFIPANLGVGFSYTIAPDNENGHLSFGLDINKLLVPIYPVATGVNSIDSVNLAYYRNTDLASSWVKSFNDGSNQLSDLKVSLGTEYNL
jgi:hypothetical protein